MMDAAIADAFALFGWTGAQWSRKYEGPLKRATGRQRTSLREVWEAQGRREERPKPIAVEDACDKFISDAEARELRELTLYKISAAPGLCRRIRSCCRGGI